jgi:hypothetical protein
MTQKLPTWCLRWFSFRFPRTWSRYYRNDSPGLRSKFGRTVPILKSMMWFGWRRTSASGRKAMQLREPRDCCGATSKSARNYRVSSAACCKKGFLPENGCSHRLPELEYFRNLNTTRVSLKHQGLFPDARQWARVGRSAFSYFNKWWRDYLDISLRELDESALLLNADLRPQRCRLCERTIQLAS